MKHLQKSLPQLFYSSFKFQLPKPLVDWFRKPSKRKPKPIDQAVTELKQIVFTQLKLQEKTKYDTKKFVQLLQSIGWTITKTGTKLQLTKQTQTHNFTAFMTIKPLVQLNNETKQRLIDQKKLQIEAIEEQLQQKRNPHLKKQLQHLKKYLNSSPYEQNVVQVAVFVSKIGLETPKFILLQFFANSQFAHLQDVSIWSRIVPSRIDRFRETKDFMGRGFSRLDYEIVSNFGVEVEEGWELRTEVLETMFHLNVAYQQEEYIKWLKNFNQIL